MVTACVEVGTRPAPVQTKLIDTICKAGYNIIVAFSVVVHIGFQWSRQLLVS